MLSQSDIFAPMVIQMIMMILIAFWLVWARVGSVMLKKVDMRDVAKNGWQGWMKNAGDNFDNQYQLPLLFFAVCFLLYITKSVTDVSVLLAWGFVASRIAHAAVHLTVNHIMTRFIFFLIGALALTALVVQAALAVL
ncbi:MAPEG family protein [Fretibacter rubidus]|uniref:MAPEG family protein n=1 Tax=Fretibacter rubidus TaxID=570162 RepID=UPI00352A0D51